MSDKDITKRTKNLILATGIFIILIILSLFFGLSVRQKHLVIRQLESHADGMLHSIDHARRWNANHRGVYVLKDSTSDAYPYLKGMDIRTVDGKIYTFKNPEMMTREISDIARENGDHTFHITSLKLTNPDNAPDAWERQALEAFEEGVTEESIIDTCRGRKVFRLMHPLYYEETCDECHSHMGYQVGDVRGGLSVNIPYEKIGSELRIIQASTIGLAVLVTIILGIILYFFVWRSTNKIIELNQEKNELLGVAAHDLRNPLGVVMGYSELLLGDFRKGLDDRQIRCISVIQKSSKSMHNLVNDLLDVSKIESGKLELNLEKTDVIGLIEQNLELNRAISDKKRIKIHFDHDKEIPLIEIDPEKFGQVLDNLISNAIKFSHPDKNIRVSVSSGEQDIIIKVQDEGQGIPEDELDSIFKFFQKGSVRGTAGEKSTGLGLAIVRKIVEGHRGTIRVESEVGKGSTFYVRLPVA